MKRKQKFILAGGIILVLLVLIVSGIVKLPLEKICTLRGGSWDGSILSSQGYCNLKTSDSGKECLSNSDCKGDCFADLSDPKIKKLNPLSATTLYDMVGKCTEWKINKGCNYEVENGVVSGMVCKD